MQSLKEKSSFTQLKKSVDRARPCPSEIKISDLGKNTTPKLNTLKCENSSVGRARPCPSEIKISDLGKNATLKLNTLKCENSSVGRARPCQGRGRGFESRFSLSLNEDARVVELVDTQDLKSCGHCGCAGSSPASSTKSP